MQRLVTLQQRYRPPSDSLSISCFPCKRKKVDKVTLPTARLVVVDRPQNRDVDHSSHSDLRIAQ